MWDLIVSVPDHCLFLFFYFPVHEVAITQAVSRVKIIYPAAGWIASYWPGKENKYDHDVSWRTFASEWDLI